MEKSASGVLKIFNVINLENRIHPYFMILKEGRLGASVTGVLTAHWGGWVEAESSVLSRLSVGTFPLEATSGLHYLPTLFPVVYFFSEWSHHNMNGCCVENYCNIDLLFWKDYKVLIVKVGSSKTAFKWCIYDYFSSKCMCVCYWTGKLKKSQSAETWDVPSGHSGDVRQAAHALQCPSQHHAGNAEHTLLYNEEILF